MTEQHAFLAPSSASVWGPGGCPAFPRMARQFPEDGDRPEAREGTAAHWWLTEAIEGREHPEGALAPNGTPINLEMIECAQAMLEATRAQKRTPGVQCFTEQVVRMPQIHPTLNWGRVDFGGVSLDDKVIFAWDYKYGHGFVDVFENWQLIDYAVGIANHFGVQVTSDWVVDLRIYQPRSFHAEGPIKKHRLTGDRFLHLTRELSVAAEYAAHPDAPMFSGKHCHHCPASHTCPALRKAGGLAVDMSLRGVASELSPENAGLALRVIRRARERLEDLEVGIEAQLMAAIRDGALTTGWELEQGYGRERWKAPAAEVIAMGQVLGVDIAKPLEPITPAQARKKGIDEAVIKEYSERPKGELKLRPLDERNNRKAFQ